MSDCVYAVMRVFMPCHHRRGSFQGVVIWCQTIMLVAVWLWTLPIQIKTFLLYFKPASQSWSKDNYYLMSFCQHAIALSYFFLQQRYLSVRFTNQAVVCFWVCFFFGDGLEGFMRGSRGCWEREVEVSRAWHVACGKVSPFITFNYHDTSGIYLLGDQVWGGSTFPQTCASLDPVTCFETQLLRVLHQEREKSEEIKPLADIDPCYKVHLPVYGNN